MKNRLLYTAALSALMIQQCSADTPSIKDPSSEIPCVSKEKVEGTEQTTIRLPLMQCLLRPQALLHCPAALAATALTVFKVIQLSESLITKGWEGKKWHTINLAFEAIVVGYLADWFLKKFVKSCEVTAPTVTS